MAVFFQKLHHDHVVIKRISGGDNLDVVGGKLLHPGKRLFQLFGAAEVVVRDNQVGRTTQSIELRRLNLGCGLKFDIHQMTSKRGCLNQQVNLSGNRPLELSSIGGPAAGSNNERLRVELNKCLQLGQPQSGLGKIV